MTALYWGLEYAKVLLCYLFILFIWPSVVFRKYLRGKSKIFRFGFCATTQIVLINTVVLCLGLLYLLNAWVVNMLFYGIFLFSIRKSLWPGAARRNELRRLVTGSLGLRTFLSGQLSDLRFWFRRMCKKLWRQVRPHLLEYILLAVIVVYGLVYFSYSPFVEHSYGFSDMNVHHTWIYSLTQGQIFSAGVYPEGMHCVVYLMHTVSGISVYSCNLFLGCIQTAVLLLSVYCLMREIFRWYGTPLLVLTAFLTIAMANDVNAVSSMSRLQYTLPGEYGQYSMFLCALFLLRFLKEHLQKDWQKEPCAWLRNENLLVFSMALAASIAIHFYVTITAFFICLPFAVVYIRRALSRVRFRPLVAAVLCGVMIAAFPMAGGLLTGIRFQGSINWALNLFNGNIVSGADMSLLDQVETESPETGSQGDEQLEEGSFRLFLKGVWKTAKDQANILYRLGYCRLFGDTLGTWTAYLSVAAAVVWLAYRLICMLLPPLRGGAGAFDCYPPIIGAFLFIMILCTAPYLKLPELIAYDRLTAIAYLLLITVVAIPVDVLLSVPQRFCPNWLTQALSVACVAAVYVGLVVTGNYHGYLYSRLIRYSSAVDVTNSIIGSFPQNTYTVVSSTDDRYQILGYGRHEELLDFLGGASQEEGYYLPTEHIFIYVEKRPLWHEQYHFTAGSFWLASNCYYDFFNRYGYAYADWEMSIGPDVSAAQISDADAAKESPKRSLGYQAYRNLDTRTIINSKAYKWCQDFAALYDNEMKIYYEDEYFVCYYFRQNTYSLYDLAIWD